MLKCPPYDNFYFSHTTSPYLFTFSLSRHSGANPHSRHCGNASRLFCPHFYRHPNFKGFLHASSGASTQNSAGFSLLKNDTEVLDQNNATGIILGTAPLSGDRVSYKVSKGDTEEFTLFVLHSNDTLPKGTIAPDRVRFDAENADISVDDGSLSIKFDLVEKE